MNHEPKTFEKRMERVAGLTSALLRSPYGMWGLGIISFVESVLVIPLVTDPFLVIYILANRQKAVLAVIVTTAASLMGGLAAYIMAAAFFDFIATHYLVGQNGVMFNQIIAAFQNNTFVLTLLGAVTPIPYTTIALVVGFVRGSVFAFIAATVLGRGARYALVGWLTYRFGEPALALAFRRLREVTVFLIAAATLYFLYQLR